MTIQRSPNALLSMHLFFKVDVVVFCEGGPSRTVEEALSHSVEMRTHDNIYWSNVVEYLGIQKRFHFKSVGSKSTILEIARRVSSVSSKTVTVCIDSDYDAHLGRMTSYPRQARTLGYSWESDVMVRPTLHNIMRILIGPPPQDATESLDAALSALESSLVKWCEIDASLKARSKPCVFDRGKPLSVVNQGTNPPSLNENALKARLIAAGYKTRPQRIFTVTRDEVIQVAFGKLIGRMMFHIMISVARRFIANININYDNFMRLAISEKFHLLRSGQLSNLADHIVAQRAAFT